MEMAEFIVNNDDLYEIDYGLGGEKYKEDWMDDKRVMVGIEAFNLRTCGGNIMYAVEIFKKYLKKFGVA
jgi:hypothetical protein